ncbi:TIGR01777 family oxidoreductase [Kribbella sp. NPDC058245]|uniref:TIGR01777 family oxidoreductase n=1 Tax=Kribbella sp. NPDC058245 TaxID=3346399 RepID=UPI0036EEE5B4
MKIVLPGGTGHIGSFLSRYFAGQGHEVVVIGRSSEVRWDGRTLGPWAAELDGADAVINLAGRSVSCRYTPANLQEMMDSRVDSARVVGEAIAAASAPPRVWMQMSTATIYAHTYGAAHDETGTLGGAEPGVPAYWKYSVDIATAWEAAQEQARTPNTRKVALRTAIVMSPDRGGAFDILRRMAKLGLGGPIAGGRQYISWLHETDMARALTFLLDNELSGPVNLAAPHPLPQRDFVRALRRAVGMPIGLPSAKWMTELGAFALRSDTELLLKSRHVVPGRLLEAGFTFEFPDWQGAAANLVATSNDGYEG